MRLPKKTITNGVEVYLDRWRNKFVPAKPEEGVRQSVASWLYSGLGYKYLDTEAYLAAAGRADIVAYADPDWQQVLVVVECKKRDDLLSDIRYDQQLARYAKATQSIYAVLTNGDPKFQKVFKRGRTSLKMIDRLPSYQECIKGAQIKYLRTERFRRWNYASIATPQNALETLRENDFSWIYGTETPVWLAPFAADLFGFLADDRPAFRLPRTQWREVEIVEDLGRRPLTFSNASGGRWPSSYFRSFHVKRWNASRTAVSRAIVSLTLFAQKKSGPESKFGSAGGYTVLAVGVEDLHFSHLSLELKLDWNVEPGRGVLRLVHDGRMTAAGGGVPKADVIRHVRKRAPDLVDNGQILLGCVPAFEPLTWKAARPVIANLIRYALLRDDVRARGRV